MLLAFPPVDLGWVGLVGLIPLCLALRGARGRAGFLLGFAFGAVFFGVLISWLSYFGELPWGALVFSQAVALALFGLFGAWASGAWIGRVLGVPALYVMIEIVRTRWPLGGFAWGGIGYTQHDGGPLLGLARVGGVHLVTLAIVGLNALFAQFLTRTGVWRRGLALAAAAALAMWPAALSVGLAGPSAGELDVALVQGNVPRGAFAGGVGDRLGRVGPEDLRIIENHIQATLPLASGKRPDLVVWPENALDRDPFTNPEVGAQVSGTVAAVGSHFIVGAILDAPEERFRNSNLLYLPDGSVSTTRYDKVHLVPFGEYVPWRFLRDRIPALEQEVPHDGVPGKEPVVLPVNDARIGAVICFESTYPDLVRRFVKEGAQVIVVSTNNASFRRSPAAAQHLAMSQLRAVEEGRVVLHAAISGITAAIGPDGKLEGKTRLFTQSVVRRSVPLATGETPYSKRGDMTEALMAEGGAIAAAAALAGRAAGRARRRERKAEQELWGGEDSLKRMVHVGERTGDRHEVPNGGSDPTSGPGPVLGRPARVPPPWGGEDSPE